jgi:hypothetical protein
VSWGKNVIISKVAKIELEKAKTTSSALLQDVGNYQCVDYDDDELQVDPGREISTLYCAVLYKFSLVE